MIELGITDGHGAGAVLVLDGRVARAVSEERLTRRRREKGFPRRSIEWVLRDAGVTARDIDRVRIASRWGRAPTRLLDRRYRESEEGGGPARVSARLFAAVENGIATTPALRTVDERASKRALGTRLVELGVDPSRMEIVDHHAAHAWSAAHAAGFGAPAGTGAAKAREVVLTLDGYGDGMSGSAWRVARDGDPNGEPRLDRMLALSWRESLGLVYGVVCDLLGFAEGDEGQVTALASGGDPDALRSLFAQLIRIAPDDSRRAPPFQVDRGLLTGELTARLASHPATDVARALQDRVEDAVVALARRVLAESGVEHESSPARIACAGGVFANVRLGARIAGVPGVSEVVIAPAMTDEGLALGAALGGPRGATSRESLFLGPSIGGDDARAALDRAGLAPDPIDAEAMTAEAARMLDEGAVIAIATGRLEFGPRALGHRSVVFDPRRTDLVARVSRALRRPPHMPFAPATLADEIERSYVGIDPLRETARHMTVAVDTTPWFRERCPATTHTDGSARVQVVTRETAPELAALLEAFRARSGIGTLVNTSFNLHGEPIAATAEDALRAFVASGLDAMWLGDRWVRRAR